MDSAYLFLNGEFEQENTRAIPIKNESLIVAVDGGIRHLAALEIIPDILIGDLDSVEANQLRWCRQQNVVILQYPPEKNETDFELALEYVITQGAGKIIVFGALGGRIDHTLANISLISSSRYDGRDIKIIAAREEIFFIQPSCIVNGKTGDLISLLPWGNMVEGVTTTNLKYVLQDETLYPDRSRGMSNVMMADNAIIECRKGKLLCVHKFM
jgi:thiamine pyrophosphokinase